MQQKSKSPSESTLLIVNNLRSDRGILRICVTAVREKQTMPVFKYKGIKLIPLWT